MKHVKIIFRRTGHQELVVAASINIRVCITLDSNRVAMMIWYLSVSLRIHQPPDANRMLSFCKEHKLILKMWWIFFFSTKSATGGLRENRLLLMLHILNALPVGNCLIGVIIFLNLRISSRYFYQSIQILIFVERFFFTIEAWVTFINVIICIQDQCIANMHHRASQIHTHTHPQSLTKR